MLRTILILFLLFLRFQAYAQADTSITVGVIEINESRIRANNLGGSQEIYEQTDLEVNNVAGLLSDKGGVFIKNYGPGSIATSTIRGGSAGHTLLLWNGLPITNPYLGLLDLSLINTQAMSKVTLAKGGNSAMWGSGAIGGVVNLEQKNNANSKILLENSFSIASFDKLQDRVKASILIGKLRSTISYSYLEAENDFSYRVGTDIEKFQSNAQQEESSFNQDFYFTPNKKNEFALHFWRTKADRQVPPLTTQRQSDAFQLDVANRISAHWHHYNSTVKISLKAAYFNEDLDYFDPAIGLQSQTNFQTFIGDLNLESKDEGMHNYSLGLSFIQTGVNSIDNYTADPNEDKIGAFGRYLYLRNKYKVQVSARQEIVDGRLIPFMPGFELEFYPMKDITIKSKITRNFRLPALNDRYWNPGGDPDLLPESGWSEEIGIVWKANLEKGSFNVSLTAFNRMIDNWIQWSLLPGNNFWSVYNLNKVWSRGLEPRMNWKRGSDKRYLQVRLGHDYILSTSQNTLIVPKVEVGDQLWYTPKHSTFVNSEVKYAAFTGSYAHRWVGPTFGINDNLDAFSIGNLALTWNTVFQNVDFDIVGKVNNIWNTDYRIVERRSMPGRNFELGLIINYEKK